MRRDTRGGRVNRPARNFSAVTQLRSYEQTCQTESTPKSIARNFYEAELVNVKLALDVPQLLAQDRQESITELVVRSTSISAQNASQLPAGKLLGLYKGIPHG